jgi:hypothetical protein
MTGSSDGPEILAEKPGGVEGEKADSEVAYAGIGKTCRTAKERAFVGADSSAKRAVHSIDFHHMKYHLRR